MGSGRWLQEQFKLAFGRLSFPWCTRYWRPWHFSSLAFTPPQSSCSKLFISEKTNTLVSPPLQAALQASDTMATKRAGSASGTPCRGRRVDSGLTPSGTSPPPSRAALPAKVGSGVRGQKAHPEAGDWAVCLPLPRTQRGQSHHPWTLLSLSPDWL